MHTPLILGADGRKLSKSHGARHIHAMRAKGWEPQHIWAAVLPWLGLPDGCDRLEDAVAAFDPAAGPLGPIHLREDPDAGGPRRGLRWHLGA